MRIFLAEFGLQLRFDTAPGFVIYYFLSAAQTLMVRSGRDAVVAELADALDSGSSGVTAVEVQVLSTAPTT